MTTFHQVLGQIVVVICGLVGLWGVAMARRDTVPRIFTMGVGVAITVTVLQVALGAVLMTSGTLEPGDQHVFYGVLVALTLVFAYIYRAQLRNRPTLAYGLLLLFTMGLGIRAIQTIGVNF
ncbi:MAG: hypothetical protein L0Z49_06005 [Actinobacteria bacterium]|nr:hypothetical protein [Actinomycetota bacterium]MCI0543986.1 hypothetical protein [Actinomycetota bacterium]MCI0677596.1 hypothetical protein [Actinomycetota bacterium]